MAFTVVLGLAVLSVANYGQTFTISGVQPTVKPFLSFTTQQPQLGDLIKSTFGLKNEALKPFGAPYEQFKQPYHQPYHQPRPFKQPYQPYQPGPFRISYQPFGPYPGYPGPVVYSGYSSTSSGFPQQHQAAYHFDDPSRHKQFGFQPFPSAPVDHQTVSPFKFGSTKKFNKSPAGSFFDFNQPGKYFQEHQFGAHHGPEFSSAVVPAEHNLKQSKPKDIFLEKPVVPAVPTFPSFGFSKEAGFGLPSPALFGYHSPSVVRPSAQFGQSFFGTAPPSVKSVPSAAQNSFSAAPAIATVTASTEVPSSSRNENPATSAASEVTVEPSSSSATPAADPQPTDPSQEEVTASVAAAAAAAEVATNNETPAADDTVAAQPQQQSEQSAASSSSEDNEPKNEETDAVTIAAVSATSENTDSVQLTDSSQVSTDDKPADAVAVPVEEVKETAVTDDASSDPSESTSEAAVVESSTGAIAPEENPQVIDIGKSELAQASPNVDVINFPEQQAGTIAASDPSAANLFAAPGFPYFDQLIGNRQIPFDPYFRKVDSSSDTNKTAQNIALTVVGAFGPNGIQSSSATPETAAEGTTGANSPALKKINTVKIIPDVSYDPFNGQLPLLYDPSSAAGSSPLDVYGFYNHPSVSALSSQASLASYSPEDAFSNFGTNQYRAQGYLVEGAPSLNPLPARTIVQTGRTPVSISSEDHPLHGQVFKYSQSFVPYPALVQAGNTAGDAPSTPAPAAEPTATSSTATAA